MEKLLKKVWNRKKKKKKKDNENENDAEGYEDLHLYEDDPGEDSVSEPNTYETVNTFQEYEESRESPRKPSYLLVAAIDLGTSASGYAFSFRNDYESNPLQISTHTWTAGSTVLRSPKAPTCILFNTEGQFHSFGYDAQDKYALLLNEKEEDFGDWYYFENFKMSLYENKDLNIHTELIASNFKPMKAITVFSESIKYLKNHLLKRCFNMKVGLKETDILWTLTVPAIWNDSAKLFMRRSAELAGIVRHQLLLALEPEVGAIFCKHLPTEVERVDDRAEKMNAFKPGTCYMVVDAGGGTVDVTVHEVLSENKVREIQAANGGPWGGTFVNKAYLKFLSDLFGQETFDEFQRTSIDDYTDILREFEVKKHTVKQDRSRVVLRLPASLLEIYQKYNSVRDLTCQKDKAELKKDKLFLSQDIFEGFFTETIDAIINHLDAIIKINDKISTILLIGGFSDSVILQNTVRKHFTPRRLIIPSDAGLCVLKGAVLFGHNWDVIECRVLKCTYGIECSNDFINGVHDRDKQYLNNTGVLKCRDVFGIIAKMGDSIPQGQASKERYVLVDESGIEDVHIAIYVSTVSASPMYITEMGCRKIGYISVDLEGNKDKTDRRIYFRIKFGDTEVRVQYRQDNSTNFKEQLLDLLGENA